MKTLKQYIKILNEGGNMFSSRRIKKAEIWPTLRHLESITGLPLKDNILGSTGKTETSGDIDIVVDDSIISKDELIRVLLSSGATMADIRKTGIQVGFRSHIFQIDMQPLEDTVQVDFMFHDEPEFLKWFYASNESPPYKGRDRNITISAIAKVKGFKISTKGLVDRATNNIVSRDPEEISKLILDEKATSRDLFNIPAIIKAIRSRFDEETVKGILKQAEETLGINLV